MKVNIWHVRQDHPNGNPLDEETMRLEPLGHYESVVQSQLDIANLLWKKKNAIVVSENADENFILSKMHPQLKADIQEAFKKPRLPEEVAKLTKTQKKFLYQYGASIILLALGKLRKVYASY